MALTLTLKMIEGKHKYKFNVTNFKTMPSLASISKIDFPYRVEQQVVKEGARNLFAPSYPQVESKLYYDTLDVMGWEFQDTGFKVLFSSDIPTIIANNVFNDVTSFLEKHHLKISDIKNFIFHPGGKKVLTAYEDALLVEGDFLKNTREVMNDNGNMSSTTVLYVLEKFFSQGFKNGYRLMVSMGPGFSCEMVLLQMQNK